MKTETLIERTKGEWKVGNTFYHIENTCVTDYNGNTIAECYRNAYHKDRSIAAANAEFIVKACNNYDSLLSALKGLYNFNLGNKVEYLDTLLNDAEDAIKKAEE